MAEDEKLIISRCSEDRDDSIPFDQGTDSVSTRYIKSEEGLVKEIFDLCGEGVFRVQVRYSSTGRFSKTLWKGEIREEGSFLVWDNKVEDKKLERICDISQEDVGQEHQVRYSILS